MVKMKIEVEYCDCCGQKLTPYPITLTRRYLIWLIALGRLNRETKGFINYKRVHELVEKRFRFVVSSYSFLARDPYYLIYGESGEYKLTKRGYDFINGRLAVPEWVHFKGAKPVEISEKLVTRDQLKDLNFQQIMTNFGTY